MPRDDGGLELWFAGFAQRIAEDPAAAGVTAEEAAELTALAQGYSAARAVAIAPDTRTGDTIALKDAARDRAHKAFRRVAKGIRFDDSIPDIVKIGLGIPPPMKGPRKRLPAPTTHPLLNLVNIQPGAHILCYADYTTPDSSRKPRGVQHLQLFRAVGEQAVDHPADATYLDSYTRSPFKVPCEDEHCGRTATYFGRWSTRTALVGPWSLPVSMTMIGPGQGKPPESPQPPTSPPPPEVPPEKEAEAEGEAPVIEVKATESGSPVEEHDS